MLQNAKSPSKLAKKIFRPNAGHSINSPTALQAENAMREQLHREIEDKSKSCNNPTYHCGLSRVDGFEYCIRHILHDQRGKYKQCTYVYGNGRKCQNAVLKDDVVKDQARTTFCFEHSRQAKLQKMHATVGKLRDVESNEVLLNKLSHHINLEEPNTDAAEADEFIDVVTPQVITFSIDKNVNKIENVVKEVQKKPRVLDFASDSSDDDITAMKVNELRADFDESDDESLGSDDDDPLRRAGIYTVEESLKLSIEKLKKVKQLYEKQADYLYHLFKESRRKYLIDLRKEREMHCSIHEQAKNNAKERDVYKKLKNLTRYHRRNGNEAILYRKYKEKRARIYDAQKIPPFPKCIFTEGGVKCGERTIPCSKYCRKHILEDKKQTLFHACSVEKSNVVCHEPTICIGDDSNCLLHLFMPPKQQYSQKKNDSETDDEDLSITYKKSENDNITTTTTLKEAIESEQSDVLTKNNNNKSSRNVEVVPIDTLATMPVKHQVDSMKTKMQQQQETIEKVLQENAIKSTPKCENNKSTTRPNKQQLQQVIVHDDGKEVKAQTNVANVSTEKTTTIKLPTFDSLNKFQQIIIKNKPLELQQQQQQIDSQLQKQQVQQTPPQIFQIQKQQQQQPQQSPQQKTMSLTNVKQIVSLQPQQLQQQQIIKIPSSMNIKQFITLPTTTQQQQQQKQQVIHIPLQRTTRFQLQPNPMTSSGAGESTGGNVTYHTIPGLPKSTTLIINKQFLPKSVSVQQQQQQIEGTSQSQQQEQ